MKIIEIGTGYTPIPSQIGAATEIVIENLIKEFNQLSINNELVDIGFKKGEQSIFNNELNTIVHVIKLPKFFSLVNEKGFLYYVKRIYYSIKVGLFLRKYLKSNKDDIFLHFHNQFNFFFFYIINFFFKKRNVKLIYTVHSPDWSFFSKIPNSLFLEKFSVKHSNLTIALTENLKKNIISLIGITEIENIIVLPNGVDTNKFNRIETIKKENVILNIGSICRRKNQIESIRVLKEFLLEYSYVFKFAGKIVDEDYFHEINSFVIQNGLKNNVIYLGEINPGDDLVNLYNTSKLYVSHSQSEAFSLVILESLSCGLPVILSLDFENSLSNYENDTFLQICSNMEFTNRIIKLTSNQLEYNIFSIKSELFIAENFSWEKIVNLFIQEIKNI